MVLLFYKLPKEEIMEILEAITDFARKAHEGQRRKFVDEPYLNHLVRVSEICKEVTSELPIIAAALLHDLLEDTEVTSEELSAFLSQRFSPEETRQTLKWVHELTDVYTHADYPKWNRDKRKTKEAERLGKISATAQTIKYADILDNSLDIMKSGSGFAPRYLIEAKMNLEKMNRGNKELYKKAKEAVSEGLRKVRGR
ncbi:HD domain-containing protein [Siphonobacter sp. SORGH_AS_1065]|uniref:HD domain-containing protein n=1 Tax=Siphonobacter sp. SORGH_AS_1065 TaxID=3041795 RepID=UPI00277FCE30|nr:HD domain-containing protein [Siphonobacter sp. SORGH_AS_1065]MDQ1089109.1 (p)ppGpp synthase/HD superfamily hydrolase [Siphonobacter sp. SORGH_AS_1065]